jgi:hypothetical protein
MGFTQAGESMFARTASMLMLVIASVASAPSISIAAPATASNSSLGACASLAMDYDQVEKSLALTYAEGVGDDSAPRETNRQMKYANDLSRASMMLTLMEARHCALPDHAPSYLRYLSPALSCAKDRITSAIGDETPSCKMESWQPMK